MEDFIMKVYLLFLSLFLLSCDNNRSSDNRYTKFDQVKCNSNQDRRTTDIGELDEIDSNNASNYKIYGTCTRDNSEIKVYVEGHPIDKSPLCQRGQWEVFANISGIVNQKARVQVAVSQAGNSDLLCKNTTNHFICPNGYIGVSQLSPYTSRDFCVMKYEAKTSEDLSGRGLYNLPLIKAESKAKGHLISGVIVTQSLAIKACTQNGVGYNLINNDQWQTIARSIEMVDVNWSEGNIRIGGGNRLNTGNISNVSSESNENDINDKRWRESNRSHKLLNGEYIWDFSGNLTEIVQHNIGSAPVSYRDQVYNMPAALKQLFGPDRDYTILGNEGRLDGAGLGYINTKNFKGGLLRGGGQGRRIGIFSANTDVDPERHYPKTGFRCVYAP